jgi:uncharacterized protein
MGSCCKKKKRFDFILWVPLTVVLFSYLAFNFQFFLGNAYFDIFSESVHELMNKMFIGIVLGVVFFTLLENVPREFVAKILGKGGTLGGIFRATLAGVLLDLCSHGILLVGMKLYQRGASLGQVMAFLIASPWNSLSLTFILAALIGVWWTLAFILLSMIIAVVSGLIFETLVKRGVLPKNPNEVELKTGFNFWKEARGGLASMKFSLVGIVKGLWSGLIGSKMILKWIFFGIVLASLIRTFLDPSTFETFFGPSVAGLGLTLIAATIIEVCSEGSTPIAADLLTRASAPGNSFAFLMTGVSTDYTEIMAIKETSKSWKVAFFLPLVTLPQIIVVALILNGL